MCRHWPVIVQCTDSFPEASHVLLPIARRCGLGVHSYTDDIQLYLHVDPAAVDNMVLQLVDCVDEISHWMSANRLN